MKLRQPGKDASKELRLIIPHNFFIELSNTLHDIFVPTNLLTAYTSAKK
jgi:hypothetical protein